MRIQNDQPLTASHSRCKPRVGQATTPSGAAVHSVPAIRESVINLVNQFFKHPYHPYKLGVQAPRHPLEAARTGSGSGLRVDLGHAADANCGSLWLLLEC